MNFLLGKVGLVLENVSKNKIHGTSYLFVIKINSKKKNIKNLLKKETYLNYSYYKK